MNTEWWSIRYSNLISQWSLDAKTSSRHVVTTLEKGNDKTEQLIPPKITKQVKRWQYALREDALGNDSS